MTPNLSGSKIASVPLRQQRHKRLHWAQAEVSFYLWAWEQSNETPCNRLDLRKETKLHAAGSYTTSKLGWK